MKMRLILMIKKILSICIVFVMCVNWVNMPAYANDKFEKRPFLIENTTEIVEIEGISYEYYYYMNEGSRVAKIVNMETNEVDLITYDVDQGTFYLNDTIIARRIPSGSTVRSLAASGWQTLSQDSFYVSLASATTVSQVASVLALYLGNLGTAGVIASMGMDALSSLARYCAGGTLYAELQMYSAPGVLPQYRYIWSFAALSGSYYGPYCTPA